MSIMLLTFVLETLTLVLLLAICARVTRRGGAWLALGLALALLLALRHGTW
jgi:hypothetical protein